MIDQCSAPVSVTTVFSGQRYMTSTIVLHHDIHTPATAGDREDVVMIINNFRKGLATELTMKFGLESLACLSPRVVASSLDPRFRLLNFAVQLGISCKNIKCHIKGCAFWLCNTSGTVSDHERDAQVSENDVSNAGDKDVTPFSSKTATKINPDGNWPGVPAWHDHTIINYCITNL